MFTMQFNTDNAAFEYSGGASETARILRKLAGRIEEGDFDGKIMDANGNSIGTFKLNGE